ncbi:MAG: helix-turn-helix domain-containing protein [Bacteroidaceae bacterium]
MDESLYHISLYLSLPLMLFFGFRMLFAPVPEKKIFANYLLSRRLMGAALLILSANYCVHLFCTLRLRDVNATILLNLSTYFLCYWLFSSAMMTLLDSRYITRRRVACHLMVWVLFSVLACVVSLCLEESCMQFIGLVVLASWLVAYGLFLGYRLLRTYTKAIVMFENTHSDDIGSYIQWLSNFTYWAVFFGVGCGVLTFLPDEFVFIWILSSIPFYIYLYCCYQNYILFYERVETALQEDIGLSEDDQGRLSEPTAEVAVPVYHAELETRIQDWIDKEGYCKQGVTLNELATELCTNRTYLSEYINKVFGRPFRDWVSSMRVDYAKKLMAQNPQMKISEVSEQSGFLSQSHFSRTFSEMEGCSPANFKKGLM